MAVVALESIDLNDAAGPDRAQFRPSATVTNAFRLRTPGTPTDGSNVNVKRPALKQNRYELPAFPTIAKSPSRLGGRGIMPARQTGGVVPKAVSTALFSRAERTQSTKAASHLNVAHDNDLDHQTRL